MGAGLLGDRIAGRKLKVGGHKLSSTQWPRLSDDGAKNYRHDSLQAKHALCFEPPPVRYWGTDLRNWDICGRKPEREVVPITLAVGVMSHRCVEAPGCWTVTEGMNRIRQRGVLVESTPCHPCVSVFAIRT